ncbi:MAG: LytTR family transcriptional regulator [Acidimicrobiia bacterium]|nr:LytTR family transcriptional regulator [Acidimicrobiia bacterium]
MRRPPIRGRRHRGHGTGPGIPRHPTAGDGRSHLGPCTRQGHTASRRLRDRPRFIRLPAFEIHALDYLLKPFSAQRFRSALAFAREHLAQRRATSIGRHILGLLPDAQPAPARPPTSPGPIAAGERLVVKSSGRIYFVKIADIDWCEAAGNYIRLHVGAQAHLIRETMNRLESQLDPRLFVRVHRSTIVNVDRIQELRSSFNGEHVVVLRNGTRLTMSRGYREALQERLKRPI